MKEQGSKIPYDRRDCACTKQFVLTYSAARLLAQSASE